MHICIYVYIYTYIHTYMHTYIHIIIAQLHAAMGAEGSCMPWHVLQSIINSNTRSTSGNNNNTHDK